MCTTCLSDSTLDELIAILDATSEALIKSGDKKKQNKIADSIAKIRKRILARQPGGVYSAALISSILEKTLTAIVIADQAGTIEHINPTAEKLFGYTEDELIGQNVRILMPEPDSQEHHGYIERFLKTGEAKVINTGRIVIGKRKDGATFPIHLGLSDAQVGDHQKFIAFLTQTKAPEYHEDGSPISDQLFSATMVNFLLCFYSTLDQSAVEQIHQDKTDRASANATYQYIVKQVRGDRDVEGELTASDRTAIMNRLAAMHIRYRHGTDSVRFLGDAPDS